MRKIELQKVNWISNQIVLSWVSFRICFYNISILTVVWSCSVMNFLFNITYFGKDILSISVVKNVFFCFLIYLGLLYSLRREGVSRNPKTPKKIANATMSLLLHTSCIHDRRFHILCLCCFVLSYICYNLF